ncbi:AEL033Cp [Eremothecium gossypii ATCC 10895]|uniref:AEL033Cp n=1 Tax=Eremothecium gossypii (strain ATCC 10895 / CBS 109.51 / FGSC 9923 / NRRL Y-1056) TaxID=284811 RepID=Q757P5_EREGS|nr:AEL033Cp [Eremothecium gossypii ATCC 10895]AAS52652.2 AEL033Cp [Eremothecium gossypii ATCC 10895]AEY96957.1 FAEL033Cp [Eremothecium gossypii FDAG1]
MHINLKELQRTRGFHPVMSNVEEHASDNESDYGSQPGAVYLGIVDTSIKESDEVTIEDTFIGGEPVWLAEDSVPKEELLRCGACKSGKNLKLLLQAFAPLDPEQTTTICQRKGIKLSTTECINADDDRVIYVFYCTACPRKGNSVISIRGVRRKDAPNDLSAKMDIASPGRDFQLNPFGVGSEHGTGSKNSSANPFSISAAGGNPFASEAANPFSAVDATSRDDSNKRELKPSTLRKLHEAQPDKVFEASKAFPGFFLFVEEESFKNRTPDHLQLPKNLKIDKTAFEVAPETDELESNPVKLDPRTEKLAKFLDDDVFQKFQEIVGYNPYQVLRYDYGGKPLYYAQAPNNFEDLVPRPSYNPSSARIFELQLMPKMILDLEEEVSIESGMDWGTIMVFTDIENYIPDFDENGVGYVSECVRVQWEPRS